MMFEDKQELMKQVLTGMRRLLAPAKYCAAVIEPWFRRTVLEMSRIDGIMV